MAKFIRRAKASLSWDGESINKKAYRAIVDTTRQQARIVESIMRAEAPRGETGSLKASIGSAVVERKRIGRVDGRVGIKKNSKVNGKDWLVDDYFGRVHFGFVGVDGKGSRKFKRSGDEGGRFIVQEANPFMFRATGRQADEYLRRHAYNIQKALELRNR